MLVEYLYYMPGLNPVGPYICEVEDFRNFFKYKPNEVEHIAVRFLPGTKYYDWVWGKINGWKKIRKEKNA